MREPHSPEQRARIIIHDAGAGLPSLDVMEQRAQELAVIGGRAASHYTDEDFRQAKLELTPEAEPDDEEMEERRCLSSQGRVKCSAAGRVRREFGSDDECVIGRN